MQPVHAFIQDDLAGEAGGGFEVEGFVEHGVFVFGFGGEFGVPIFIDIDMTGGAGAGTAAFGLNRQAVIADNLHQTPALGGFEIVGFSGLVGDMDDHGNVIFPLR